MPRGQGKRCSGYLSSDGRFAYCTREEHRGIAPLQPTEPPAWRHILEGDCRCGVVHREAPEPSETVYDYVDANGTLLYQVVRLPGKQFRQRRPDGNGGWIWSLGETKRVLYRLPAVLDAAALGETVYVVEGERDVESIEDCGRVGTTNPGGAGKWRSEYAEALRGAEIVVVADRDDVGIAHARTVAATLPARSVRIVTAAVGKDVTDHVNAQRTLDELVPLDPDETPTEPVPSIVTLYHFIHENEETAEAVIGENGETLLPVGGLLILGGEGGSSKTTLTLDAIAHICSGTPWQGFPVKRPIRALILENEGPRAQFRDKLRAKTETWQGDDYQYNVFIWEDPWAVFNFTDPNHRHSLRNFVTDREIDLVIADPLDSLGIEGAGTPENVRTFIGHLKDCGLHNSENPLAFWILHHYNKIPGGSIIQRLSGAWGGHPDAVLGVELGEGQTTKLTWGKLRHATPPAEKTVILAWDLETRGFRPISKPEQPSDDELRETVLAYVLDHPGEPRSAIEDAVKGRREAIRETLENLSSPAAWGDQNPLARGPGRAKNGIYYFPSNHPALRSPQTLRATPGEQQPELPGTERSPRGTPTPP